MWARDMSDSAIAQGRQRDMARKQSYYTRLNEPPVMPRTPALESPPPSPPHDRREDKDCWRGGSECLLADRTDEVLTCVEI